MKKIDLIALLLMSLLIQTVSAQQINRVQRGQRGYTPPSNQPFRTYIDIKDPQEEIENIVPICVEKLQLDDFQKEIFKSILFKKIEDDNVILTDKGNSREDRKKKLIDRENLFITDLSSILTTDQIEKYKLIDFSQSEGDKKKKKRNKRDKKNKTH